jgi:hypothetical protein
MRVVRVVIGFFVLLVCSVCLLNADSFLIVKSKRLTVMGTLTGETAIGSKGAAWCLQLNPVIMVDGTQISALEIKSSDTHRLASLEDKFVQARGKLTFIPGGEAAQAPVFELWSIKEHKSKSSQP